MNCLDHLSLRWKLAVSPAACLLLLIVASLLALFSLAKQRSHLEDLAKSQLPRYDFAVELDASVRDLNALLNQSVGYASMGYSDKEIGAIDTQLLALLNSTSDKLKKRLADETAADQRERLQEIEAQMEQFNKAARETLDMKAGSAAVASTFLQAAQKLSDQLLLATGTWKKQQSASMRGDLGVVDTAAHQVLRTIVGATLMVLLVGGAVSWILANGMMKRMRYLSVNLAQLTQGNLSRPMESDGRDEIGRVLIGMEALRVQLVTSISAVRDASDCVRTSASEISVGNADLSRRTEHQASSLQQTAASMEQLTSAVRQNTETSLQAATLAGSAKDAASRGGEVVNQVIDTMGQISAHSRKISEIISTIDSIAFQTNILALNAAVEAARAGEQGRGFSVVASEVSALALSAAKSAREIAELIKASVERVEAGSRLVDDAGQTMQDIVNRVSQVSVLLSEISSATVEQSAGIELVGDAVNQLDQVTQQNAALVEQAAAAAESLSHQATRLVESVEVFSV